MQCEFSNQNDAYLDGEMPASARVNYENHLKSCSACSQLLAQSQRLSGFVATAKSAKLSRNRRDRIHLLISRESSLVRFGEVLLAIAASVMLASSICLFKIGDSSASPGDSSSANWENAAINQKLDLAESPDLVVQVLLRDSQ